MPISRASGTPSPRHAPTSSATIAVRGSAVPEALVHGFTGAFVAGAIVAGAGIVAALTMIRRDDLETAAQPAPEAVPAFDLAA